MFTEVHPQLIELGRTKVGLWVGWELRVSSARYARGHAAGWVLRRFTLLCFAWDSGILFYFIFGKAKVCWFDNGNASLCYRRLGCEAIVWQNVDGYYGADKCEMRMSLVNEFVLENGKLDAEFIIMGSGGWGRNGEELKRVTMGGCWRRRYWPEGGRQYVCPVLLRLAGR